MGMTRPPNVCSMPAAVAFVHKPYRAVELSVALAASHAAVPTGV